MQLRTDDRQAGLEAPDGRSFRPDSDGVITLPEELAAYGRRAARLAPMFRVYKRGYAGFDAAELAARYAAWAARQERS
ncbi:MAG TPA: hypothetical protein VGP33_01770 [Chloroflexota bacterium]|nr:hypothetical protein [Chloroflexota bacterium]